MLAFDNLAGLSLCLQPLGNTERTLILQAMQLCSWLYLRDVDVDLTFESAFGDAAATDILDEESKRD